MNKKLLALLLLLFPVFPDVCCYQLLAQESGESTGNNNDTFLVLFLFFLCFFIGMKMFQIFVKSFEGGN